MEQMTLDLFIEQSTYEEVKENDEIQVGDSVRLITDHLNEEGINYYKYYHPEALTMAGVVVEIFTSSANNYTKILYKNGETVLIEVKNMKKEVLAKYS